jgi:hypothetical protein
VRRRGWGKAQEAFQRGLIALAQWVEREGVNRPVPRGHSEQITVDGEAEPVIVKRGVWISNTKSRRDRLDADQLTALAKLGIDRAYPVPAPEPGPAQHTAAHTVPPKRPSQRVHHDECEKALHEGGTCTCDLIEQYGPPSPRDAY